jgi:sodium-independent sulfate anion transporter 11
MASTATKIGHGAAKILGIDLHYRNETGSDRITRGESVFSIDSADSYVEHEPTALEWLGRTLPNGKDMREYAYSLFPFIHWITRYNLQWLIGDLVAGKSDKPDVWLYANMMQRYHRWRRRRSPEHGLCQAC